MSLVKAAANVTESATKAIESSRSELLRLELQNIRLRAALREAIQMVREGYMPERLQILQDFLDGKREGL